MLESNPSARPMAGNNRGRLQLWMLPVPTSTNCFLPKSDKLSHTRAGRFEKTAGFDNKPQLNFLSHFWGSLHLCSEQR
jgi:hypothetical protein